MKPQDFINSIKDAAIEADKKYGIPASLTISQAILESGWGLSGLASNYHNLFGIKATSSWTGKSVNLSTKEFRSGAYEDVKDYFKVYDSFTDSIADHTKVLLQDRYAPVRVAKDYKEACRQIQACGYATSPTYAENLIRLIEQYKLNQYDITATDLQPAHKLVQAGTQTLSTYTVKSGDTLSTIAARFGMTLSSIVKLNPQIKNPDKIYPGDVVKLSAATAVKATPSKATYTVKDGDSMWAIAKANKMSLSELASKNPQIKDLNLIYKGQIINL